MSHSLAFYWLGEEESTGTADKTLYGHAVCVFWALGVMGLTLVCFIAWSVFEGK